MGRLGLSGSPLATATSPLAEAGSGSSSSAALSSVAPLPMRAAEAGRNDAADERPLATPPPPLGGRDDGNAGARDCVDAAAAPRVIAAPVGEGSRRLPPLGDLLSSNGESCMRPVGKTALARLASVAASAPPRPGGLVDLATLRGAGRLLSRIHQGGRGSETATGVGEESPDRSTGLSRIASCSASSSIPRRVAETLSSTAICAGRISVGGSVAAPVPGDSKPARRSPPDETSADTTALATPLTNSDFARCRIAAARRNKNIAQMQSTSPNATAAAKPTHAPVETVPTLPFVDCEAALYTTVNQGDTVADCDAVMDAESDVDGVSVTELVGSCDEVIPDFDCDAVTEGL